MADADEALINAAFEDLKEHPPEELASERAELVSKYADENMLTPLMRAMLHKLLQTKPADPVAYLARILDRWEERMVVVLGPPASGKRTLGEKLAGRLGLEVVCPADLIRGLKSSKTELGQTLKEMSSSEEGIPDEVIEDLVLQRLQEKDCVERGWVLDGWPRTAEQAARMVQLGVAPQYAIVLEVPNEDIEARVSFRLLNPYTGQLYHMLSDPPPIGEARKCISRPGETSEEVQARLEFYHQSLPEIMGALRVHEPFRDTLSVDGTVPLSNYDTVVEDLSRRIGV